MSNKEIVHTLLSRKSVTLLNLVASNPGIRLSDLRQRISIQSFNFCQKHKLVELDIEKVSLTSEGERVMCKINNMNLRKVYSSSFNSPTC